MSALTEEAICPICKSGPVFVGNASEFGHVVDVYEPCACPEPTDADAPDWSDDRFDYPDFPVPVVDYDVPNPWISIGF